MHKLLRFFCSIIDLSTKRNKSLLLEPWHSLLCSIPLANIFHFSSTPGDHQVWSLLPGACTHTSTSRYPLEKGVKHLLFCCSSSLWWVEEWRMSEQLIQASRGVHLFLSYAISPSAEPGPCVGATIWPHGPHMAPSHRETLKSIKLLPYTFMAAPSHSPICPPDGFCTSIRLSYMNLCYEALPSWPRCPHLPVTRDVQYFKNLVYLVFKLEQTIWIYVFYIFKTYQQNPHGHSLPEVSESHAIVP